MNDNFVHDQENSEDTQQHLQENAGKFETDCTFLLRLMMKGERLTGKTVMKKYEIHDRRLRDLFIAGKCKREWKLNDKGKRMYVEYFIIIPKRPTKREVINMYANQQPFANI